MHVSVKIKKELTEWINEALNTLIWRNWGIKVANRLSFKKIHTFILEKIKRINRRISKQIMEIKL